MVSQQIKIAIIFIIIFFSISASSILVLLSNATAVSCAFWRTTIAGLILSSIYLLRNNPADFILDRRTLLYSIISGIFLASHFLLWMESLFIVPVSVSTTIVVTYPLFSALIDCLIRKERIELIQVIGFIMGFLGITLFMHPWLSAEYDILGVLFSLGGSLSATGYFSIGRSVRRRASLLTYTTLAYTSSSVILLLYAIIIGENLVRSFPQALPYFLLLALLPMIGGHTLINYILRYMKTGVATSIALGEPIGASILAYLILRQKLDLWRALVMSLVLISIVLVISRELKREI